MFPGSHVDRADETMSTSLCPYAGTACGDSSVRHISREFWSEKTPEKSIFGSSFRARRAAACKLALLETGVKTSAFPLRARTMPRLDIGFWSKNRRTNSSATSKVASPRDGRMSLSFILSDWSRSKQTYRIIPLGLGLGSKENLIIPIRLNHFQEAIEFAHPFHRFMPPRVIGLVSQTILCILKD